MAPGGGAKAFLEKRRHTMSKANSVPGGSMPLDVGGIDGKLTRADLHMKSRAFGPEGSISDQTGISVFDPSLCELMYLWFSPEKGTVIDPFAGGSVRGIVASRSSRNYIGVELRQEQVDANRDQAKKICQENRPNWICGDSSNIDKLCKDVEADFIFTCPPYADLERYSDDPKDLSTMDYPKFLKAYAEILTKTAMLLKDDRFACLVVGEVRNKKTGIYHGFVPDTIRAMQSAGLKYYNELILVTATGSLPLRAGRTFQATRKIGKTHQNILVFVKGDPKKAAMACGEVDIASGEDAI